MDHDHSPPAVESIPSDVLDLIEAAYDRALSEEEVHRLEAALSNEPQRLLFVLEYCQLHSELLMRSRSDRALEKALASLNPADAAAESPHLAVRWPGGRSAASWFRRHANLALLLAIVLFGGVCMWAISRYRLPVEQTPVVQTHSQDAARVAATLLRTRDAVWADGKPAVSQQASERSLVVGQQLQLVSGLAEIEFRSGALVVLEGPATLVLESNLAGRLQAGKLTANVPAAAVGFSMHTPGAKIIDLGTEFGVWVKSEDRPHSSARQGPVSRLPPRVSTEVHVFHGWVAAVRLDAAGKSESRPIDVGAGQALQIDAQSDVPPQLKTSDSSKFVRSLDGPRPLRAGDIIISQKENEGTLLRLPDGDVIASGFRGQLFSPMPIVFGLDGQHFYTFARSEHARKARLLRVLAGIPGGVTIISDRLPGPYSSGSIGLAVEAEGSVLAGAINTRDIEGRRTSCGEIIRIDTRQQNVWKTVVSDLPGLPAAIAIAPGGEIYLAVQPWQSENQPPAKGNQQPSTGYIARLDPKSGVTTPLIRDLDPCAMIVAPNGRDLLVAVNLSHRETEIRRYGADGAGQGRVTLFGDVKPPGTAVDDGRALQLRQLALEPGGTLLAAFPRGGGLWRVDLTNGQQTRIHDQGDLQGVGVVGN